MPLQNVLFGRSQKIEETSDEMYEAQRRLICEKHTLHSKSQGLIENNL